MQTNSINKCPEKITRLRHPVKTSCASRLRPFWQRRKLFPIQTEKQLREETALCSCSTWLQLLVTKTFKLLEIQGSGSAAYFLFFFINVAMGCWDFIQWHILVVLLSFVLYLSFYFLPTFPSLLNSQCCHTASLLNWASKESESARKLHSTSVLQSQ